MTLAARCERRHRLLERCRARWTRLLVLLPIAVLAAAASLSAQPPVATRFAWEDELTGADENRLRWPTAIAAGGIDEIAVVDAAGPTLWIFRDLAGGEGWTAHTSIALPAAVHSLACGEERYLISTREPGRLLTVERPGYEVRELSLPPGVTPGAVTCTSDGRLIVHDLAAGRILLIGPNTEILTSVRIDEAIAALSAAAGGGFYATFPQAGEVRRYGANGEVLAVLPVPGLDPAPAWPVGLIVQPNGEVITVDRHGGRILILETSGQWVGSGSRRGWEPGLLRFPSDAAQLPDGHLAVADEGNGRVQIFRPIQEQGRQ